MLDTALDRSVALGYGNAGFLLRTWLPTWPADPPRLDGKVVLVTGAGSGLGLAAAAGFARLGASVRALGRTETRAAEAVRRALERAPGTDVRPVACDLAERTALREFLDRFTATEDRLDVLVNNAGVMPDERRFTSEGIELTFATQVLAPWILIDGLADLLRSSAPSRVINVSSGGQYGQQIPAGDLQSLHSTYEPKKIYARTKRELVTITEHWAQKLSEDGISVHAMHPGWADTEGVRSAMPLFRTLTLPILRNPDQGADTILWLGGAPEAGETTGLFWHDRRPRPTTYSIGAGADPEHVRRELWDHLAALAASVRP